MVYLIWLLRIVHILGGIFWVGATLFNVAFLGPTIAATGEAGQKFMGHMVGALKLSNRLAAAAGLTVAAGAALYWIDSAGFTSAWMSSGAGRGFGIGAFFGLIGFITGNLVGMRIRGIQKIASQIQGKPSPEQMNQLNTLRQQQMLYSKITAVTLVLSVIFMSIARYMGL